MPYGIYADAVILLQWHAEPNGPIPIRKMHEMGKNLIHLAIWTEHRIVTKTAKTMTVLTTFDEAWSGLVSLSLLSYWETQLSQFRHIMVIING